MTIHERITQDMLDMFDKGTFERHNLEYLIKELLQGDEQYAYLNSEYKMLKNSSADNDAIIRFLKKELIKKTYCRQVMKRQYRELKQKYDALLKKSNPIDTRFNDFVNGVRFGRFIEGGNGKEKSHNED